MTQTTPAEAALTPSETVILFGDRFARTSGLIGFKYTVLLSGATVDADSLAVAAVRAAVRAAVEAGSLVAEVEQQKALFGLVKRMRVRLRPGSRPSPFPAGTLESALVPAGPTFLRDALVALIATESTDPAGRLLGIAKRPLVERGLLGTLEKKTLLVFTTTELTVPEATRALADRTGSEEAAALLRRGEQADAALWERIEKEVGDALSFMVPSRD